MKLICMVRLAESTNEFTKEARNVKLCKQCQNFEIRVERLEFRSGFFNVNLVTSFNFVEQNASQYWGFVL